MTTDYAGELCLVKTQLETEESHNKMLLNALKGIFAALDQNAVYPADVAYAKSIAYDALAGVNCDPDAPYRKQFYADADGEARNGFCIHIRERNIG